MWLANASLGGRAMCCYNPSLVRLRDGRRLLFYRLTPRSGAGHTRIACVELGPNLRPVTPPRVIALPRISSSIVAFEDPRAFVLGDELWLLHSQASYTPERGWSAATALARLDADLGVAALEIPEIGRNVNASWRDAPPAIDRNWTPLVVGDELYVVYELNPLTVFRRTPAGGWERVTHEPWASPWSTYLSGGTPLLPWKGAEYLGAFHTYETVAGQRTYAMGFWTLDVERWRVSRISPSPALRGWSDRFADRRPGARRRLLQGSRRLGEWLVVFPAGIVDDGDRWIVSLGWNDCRSILSRFDKGEIERGLVVPAQKTSASCETAPNHGRASHPRASATERAMGRSCRAT